MGLIKDFKGFILRGNVLDLAVAVIIGAAFGKIVTSFVNDILMPPIGLALGDVDFAELKYILKEGKEAVMNGEEIVTEAVAEVAINYGLFINTIINFVIVAFCIFLVIKAYERSKKKEEEAPAEPPKPSNEEVLLGEIRDLLKK